MTTTINRLIAERDEAFDEPMEILGAMSDDVAKYAPLAASALTEVATSQLKQKEDADKAKAFAASDAGKAAAAAKDTRLKANLAAADAAGELDPNGPKHKAATDLELAARSAEARAAVYGVQPGSTTPGAPGSTPGAGGASGGHSESFFSKYKVPLIVGGGVLGLLTIILVARKK